MAAQRRRGRAPEASRSCCSTACPAPTSAWPATRCGADPGWTQRVQLDERLGTASTSARAQPRDATISSRPSRRTAPCPRHPPRRSPSPTTTRSAAHERTTPAPLRCSPGPPARPRSRRRRVPLNVRARDGSQVERHGIEERSPSARCRAESTLRSTRSSSLTPPPTCCHRWSACGAQQRHPARGRDRRRAAGRRPCRLRRHVDLHPPQRHPPRPGRSARVGGHGGFLKDGPGGTPPGGSFRFGLRAVRGAGGPAAARAARRGCGGGGADPVGDAGDHHRPSRSTPATRPWRRRRPPPT